MRAGLCVSLSGAAGTLSAMEGQGPQVRAALAAALDLRDPARSWHSDRSATLEFAGWMAGLTASLGKIGQDLILAAQTGISEVLVEGAGASSTMPQKQNPVGPSVLVTLARSVAGLSATMTGAGLHSQQRDGAAWFAEWLTLPAMAVSTGRAIALAAGVATRIRPAPAAMQRGLEQDCGAILAEAASFALAGTLGREAAQASVKALSREAIATGAPLMDLLARDHAGIDWPQRLSGPALVGTAAEDARAFAEKARETN